MYLRIKQIRKGGTQVILGKGDEARRVYHFRPRDPAKALEYHVCDVTDQNDLATLLAIPEGYEIDKVQQAPKVAVADPKAQTPEPTPQKPAVQPSAPQEPAASGKAKAPQARKVETAEDLEKLPKAELLKRASKKLGKPVHHSTGVKKLVAMLTGE